MKDLLKHIIIIIVIGLFPSGIKAQTILKAENAHVLTGRTVYISGESVLYTGFIEGGLSESRVVYTELITPMGDKINQGKQEINNTYFSGEITIPENTLSGYYYLRSYTKWMRNGTPDNYAYVLLKIINPQNKNLLAVPDSLIDKSIRAFHIVDAFQETANYIVDETISFKQYFNDGKLSCLSIIPNLPITKKTQNKIKIDDYSQLVFYPETRGLSLSGKLIQKSSKKPLAFHLINLHILGDMDFISVFSDAQGCFHFALPQRYGPQELFIIAASTGQDEIQIQIDQDFCNQAIAIPVPEFIIQEKEKGILLQMAQKQQLDQMFYQEDTLVELFQEPSPFYGVAFKTLSLDYYVPFDSLQQYFTDIPSWVSLKIRKGKRYFQLIGQQSELKVYDPLVLVDWIPVDDINRVLAIHPNNVKQIEVVNEVYVHGEIIYGGIINILTKNTDFGGLKFPESGMYLGFAFYDNPHLQITESVFKNTEFWMPNVSMDTTLSNFEIRLPQIDSEYIIRYQRIDNDGKYSIDDKIIFPD